MSGRANRVVSTPAPGSVRAPSESVFLQHHSRVGRRVLRALLVPQLDQGLPGSGWNGRTYERADSGRGCIRHGTGEPALRKAPLCPRPGHTTSTAQPALPDRTRPGPVPSPLGAASTGQ